MRTEPNLGIDYASLCDLDLAKRCAKCDRFAVQQVLNANNQRMFRTAWSILKNRSEAEDAVQTAYASAFANIASFEGRSSLSTWLTRIVLNEALRRRAIEERRVSRFRSEGVANMDSYRDALMRGSETEQPDALVAREEIRNILEHAVAQLPTILRTAFILRDVEGLSNDETARILDIPPGTVKTRLFRSRMRLKEILAPELASAIRGSFPFAGSDCADLTKRVIGDLGL